MLIRRRTQAPRAKKKSTGGKRAAAARTARRKPRQSQSALPAASQTLAIQPRVAVLQIDKPAPARAKGYCVLLHGWNSDGNAMLPLSVVLQQLPAATGWDFRRVTYETHLKTFRQAAGDIAMALQAAGVANPVLLGYSEGGIVARQLIADGMDCKAVVTICAPHQGLGWWIPTPDEGSASISPWSADLKALNADPVDRAHRRDYHFFAITCNDLLGDHSDDGVVPAASGLGTTLGPVAERTRIHLDYGTQIAGWDPHHRGMDPRYLSPVVATCARLFKDL